MKAIYSLIVRYFFRHARVHFHILRDTQYSNKVFPSLREGLHKYARAIAPQRKDRSFVQFHFRYIMAELVAKTNRRTLIAAQNSNVRVDYNIPRPTEFVFYVSLHWSFWRSKRRIDVTLVQLKMRPYPLNP